MGLSDINDIDWGKDGEGRVYTFLRDHRKVKYIEALVGGEVGYIGFGEAHRKVKGLKALARRGVEGRI